VRLIANHLHLAIFESAPEVSSLRRRRGLPTAMSAARRPRFNEPMTPSLPRPIGRHNRIGSDAPGVTLTR
jgi:hypothetical protein